MAAAGANPSIFVSYAHDNEDHKHQVLVLAECFMESGVRTELDQWATTARQDWYAWAIEHMRSADFVVVVVSECYKRVGDGYGPAHVNRGVQTEAALLRDLLHRDRETWLPKILPVLLPGHEIDEIPDFLQPYSADHYWVSELTVAGIEDLLRVITNQPLRVRPVIGRIPVLSPVPNARDVPPEVSWTPRSLSGDLLWRTDIMDDRGQFRLPALELALQPVGRSHRLQVRRLEQLPEELAALGRARGLFGSTDRLTVGWSDEAAWAMADTAEGMAGLAVHRNAQRSLWTRLPRGFVGTVLVRDVLVRRIAEALQLLVAVDLPDPDKFSPAAAIEPLDLVRIGEQADLWNTTAHIPLRHGRHIRLPAKDALRPQDFRDSAVTVAEELCSRLTAQFEREFQ